MNTLMIVWIMSAYVCIKCALSLHQVCIFITQRFSPEKTSGDMQTWCKKRVHSAHFVHTRCILSAHFISKVCIWRTVHTWPECASLQKSGMHILHTFSLVCKVCIMLCASSSTAWAYTGEIFYSPSASKFCPWRSLTLRL